MNRRMKFFMTIISVSVLVFIIVCFFVDNKLDVKNTKPIMRVDANTLYNSFLVNQKKANSMYIDEVVEVSGSIEKISILNQRNTIFLDLENTNSTIICDMEEFQKGQVGRDVVGEKVKIKGLCKGFLEDVILLNCFLVYE